MVETGEMVEKFRLNDQTLFSVTWDNMLQRIRKSPPLNKNVKCQTRLQGRNLKPPEENFVPFGINFVGELYFIEQIFKCAQSFIRLISTIDRWKYGVVTWKDEVSLAQRFENSNENKKRLSVRNIERNIKPDRNLKTNI